MPRGAQPPGRVGVQFQPCVGMCARVAAQHPAVGGAGAGPGSARRSGHAHLQCRVLRGVHPAQGMRQGSQKGVQHRREERRIGEARPVGGLADLLLVGPVLGEVPGGVQPHRRGPGASPPHLLADGVGVDGGPERGDPVAVDGQQLDEDRWAEAAGGGHPLVVDAVKEDRQRLVLVGLRGGEVVAVAGQASDVVAEHVGGEVLDAPARTGRGALPVVGVELAQQVDEGGLLGGEQWPGVDGGSQPGRVGHRLTSLVVRGGAAADLGGVDGLDD